MKRKRAPKPRAMRTLTPCELKNSNKQQGHGDQRVPLPLWSRLSSLRFICMAISRLESFKKDPDVDLALSLLDESFDILQAGRVSLQQTARLRRRAGLR